MGTQEGLQPLPIGMRYTATMRLFDEITLADMRTLDERGAVILLHDLLISEIRRLSLPFDLVTVPHEINVADGGIDGDVIINDSAEGSELVFEGRTCYQVKSGENISFTEAGIRGVICDRNHKLKPKVLELAKQSGNLVLFFTAKSLPGVSDAINTTKDIITQEVPGADVAVHIVQADGIIRMLAYYPALKHRLLHLEGQLGLSFDLWERKAPMDYPFVSDEGREEQINNLRTLIRSDKDIKIIRVIGSPGTGKTRSVLEALRADDLEPLTLYFENPSKVLDYSLVIELGVIRRNDAILIVDECDPSTHEKLAEDLSIVDSNMKIITIYNESRSGTHNGKVVDLNHSNLSEETIAKIIENHGLQNDIARRWARFCSNSPRAAHDIAMSLRLDHQSSLHTSPSLDGAMNLLLANRGDIGTNAFTIRKTVLMWLSLFLKFGWSRELAEERRFIIHKIMSKTGYSETDISMVVKDLRDRKVLQGENTLYISPRILHVKAWVWWWELYSDDFSLADILQVEINGKQESMPSKLFDWFIEMFQYAHGVAGASKVVADLLSSNGSLGNRDGMENAISTGLFNSLAIADPENALILLEKWFDETTDEDLVEYCQNRMNIVRALEGIAVWGSLFTRAARLLLRLAYAEQDHTYANNSEGAFAGLFSNAPHFISPTEAAPEERYPIMEQAVNSDETNKQLIGLKAVDQALEYNHWVRAGGIDEQGFRPPPALWSPSTYGELFTSIRNAWLLLLEVIPDLEGDPLEAAQKIVHRRIRKLLEIAPDAGDYIAEYTNLVKRNLIPMKDAVEFATSLSRYGTEIRPATAEGIKMLKEYTDGNDFSSRLKRYIAYGTHGYWLEEDETQEELRQISLLASDIVQYPNTLAENRWLFSQDAQNGFLLGEEIAGVDEDNALHEHLVSLQEQADKDYGEQASPIVLAGYFSGIYKRDAGRWAELMEDIAKNNSVRHWYAQIAIRSNVDDHVALVILRLVVDGAVDPRDMMLFRFGRLVENISNETFDGWMEFLLSCQTFTTASDAVELFFAYYIQQEGVCLPKELAIGVLTNPSLLKSDRYRAQNIQYEWSQVAERYVIEFPEDADPILDFLIEHIGESDTIFSGFGRYAADVLDKIALKNPKRAWGKTASYLNDGLHLMRLSFSWLGSSLSFHDEPKGSFGIFPNEVILDWVEESPLERAYLVARLVPHDYDHGESEYSWFATLLEKYGDNPDVIAELNTNFRTEGFSGPSSMHFRKKIDVLARFTELHKGCEKIEKWVSEMTSSLESDAKYAALDEERRDY